MSIGTTINLQNNYLKCRISKPLNSSTHKRKSIRKVTGNNYPPCFSFDGNVNFSKAVLVCSLGILGNNLAHLNKISSLNPLLTTFHFLPAFGGFFYYLIELKDNRLNWLKENFQNHAASRKLHEKLSEENRFELNEDNVRTIFKDEQNEYEKTQFGAIVRKKLNIIFERNGNNEYVIWNYNPNKNEYEVDKNNPANI